MDHHSAPPDRAVARIAGDQHNVISAVQLLQCGLSKTMIKRRRQRGWLHRVHHEVYAVGGDRLTREARFMAATLAARGSALSHGSAAFLWEIRRGLLSPVHISLPTRSGRGARPGLIIHRPRGPLETTEHLGIPVTTVARTLLDLAESLSTRDVERAIDTAHYRGILDLAELHAVIAAHPNRTGARRLRRILARHTPGSTRTRSHHEERFLRWCAEHGLPKPVMNSPAGRDTVDARFPGYDLIVEIDPWHTHGTPLAFREDRARDRRHLADAGTPTFRMTDEDFTPQTADELRRTLTRSCQGFASLPADA
jgi:hypothetical protein